MHHRGHAASLQQRADNASEFVAWPVLTGNEARGTLT